jgi:hypothetical protein
MARMPAARTPTSHRHFSFCTLHDHVRSSFIFAHMPSTRLSCLNVPQFLFMFLTFKGVMCTSIKVVVFWSSDVFLRACPSSTSKSVALLKFFRPVPTPLPCSHTPLRLLLRPAPPPAHNSLNIVLNELRRMAIGVAITPLTRAFAGWVYCTDPYLRRRVTDRCSKQNGMDSPSPLLAHVLHTMPCVPWA